VVVCEGYTDVIGFFQAGVPRAVATCGTALAEEHFTLLRNFAKRIVLAYDADSAGQSATSRVYEWERKHEVDVVVADLPGGSDPGELARSDPEALARAWPRPGRSSNSGSTACSARATSSTAEGRARAADAALDGRGRAPRRPGAGPVRHAAVRPLPARCRPPAGAARAPAGPPAGRDSRTGPGLEALKLAVHRPEDVADRVHPVLFIDPLQREAFTALLEHDSLHDAIASATPEVAGLLRRVTVEEPFISDAELGDPVDSVVAVLLRGAVRRALSDVEIESRGVDASWQAGAAETAQVRLWLAELDDSAAGNAAAERLVAWLSQRGAHEG
jgi:DNA primase